MSDAKANIKFQNVTQIINMGGPWIGDLYIDDELIDNNVIIDNVVYRQDLKSLFFVKYHRISKWQINNYFTINSWDSVQNLKKESEDKFDMLYISEGRNNEELLVYKAFHDKVKTTSFRIDKLLKK
jgi:hypothetical protein